MGELHNSMTGAHLGAKKLTCSLFARVWWLKLHASVIKSISACDVFKKTKDTTSLSTGLLNPLLIPTSRFTSWSMDSATDFPLSQGCYFCVCRLFDKYTKSILCFVGEDLFIAEQFSLLFFHRNANSQFFKMW